MAIDFFGVKLSGRIRQFPRGSSIKGRVIELWTKPQSTNMFDLRALAFISQVTVEYTFGENVKLAMVLTPPYEDGLALLQSELVRFGVGRLEVEFGYTTGTSTGGGATSFTQLPFSGFLQQPDVTIGKDITITLNAHGVGYQMNVIGGTESKAFPNGTTWAQAVEMTLRKYVMEDGGAKSLEIDNLYSDVPAEQRASDPFFKEPAVTVEQTKPDAPAPVGIITKGPRNDWWFVRETIENFGYDLQIFGNEIRVVEKTGYFDLGIGGKTGRKKFLLRGNVDPTRNMFPILNFSSSSATAWITPGVGKMLMSDYSVGKKPSFNETHAGSESSSAGAEGKVTHAVDVADFEIDAVSASNISAEAFSQTFGDDDFEVDSVSGSDLSAAHQAEVVQAGANLPGDPNDLNDRRKAASEWKSKQMIDGIVGEFTTLGIPNLRPGEAVEVSGFEKFGDLSGEGALFNGIYGVQAVRHQVGVGGWTTTFTGTIGAFHKDAMLARAKANKVAVAKQARLAIYSYKRKSDGVKRIPIDPQGFNDKPGGSF